MGVLLPVLLCFLPLLGFPYALYLNCQKLDKPVVVFTARIWRNAFWLLPLLVSNGSLLGLAGLLVARPRGLAFSLSGVALALVALGLSFIILRLHVSY